MRLCIRSRNTTPIGMLISFLGGGLLAVAAFRLVWDVLGRFSLGWWVAAVMFLGALAIGQALMNVREYTFAAASRTLTVRERWLGFIRRTPRLIGFAEISAVYLHSQESVYPVVVLRSGKKLYPRWPGTLRQIHRYCAVVKRITHVGRISTSERNSRRRRQRIRKPAIGEILKEARAGICPRCGTAAGAGANRCPACDLRLR